MDSTTLLLSPVLHHSRRVAANRHRNSGCNNLFFDGHADWLKAEDNTSLYWCGIDAR